MTESTNEETTELMKTQEGIAYHSLIEDEEEYDIQGMITEALEGFGAYDFSNRIEVFILYSDRDEFEEYLLAEFNIVANSFKDRRAFHYDVENKSILGVEVGGLETTTLMTYALGRVIEYVRIRLDKEKGLPYCGRPGYRYWVEFFSQTKASLNRNYGSLYPDSPLRSFVEILPYKEEMFQQTEIDLTFLQLIDAMSDLMYYVENDQCEFAMKCFGDLEENTDSLFAGLFKDLFEFLRSYLKEAGEFYTAIHDYALFDEIEVYKKRMTNYFI